MYFTKYIETGEEINTDDFFFHPKGHITQCKEILESLPAVIVNYNGEQFSERDIKKVKLFLCSRDIQVGDKVTDPEGNSDCVVESITKAGLIRLRVEKKFYTETIDGCFKVIGEISPDALSFVNEGDEFTEDQIRTSQKGIKEIFANIMQIKGPCGHFH